MPLRHRHGYHAALHRGLPAGTTSPAQEFSLRDEGARRTAPGPDPPGSSRSVIKGRITPVPLVLLSVMLPDPHHLAVLARPGPVGAACHPPRHLPGSGCPQLPHPYCVRGEGEGLSPPLQSQRLTAHRRAHRHPGHHVAGRVPAPRARHHRTGPRRPAGRSVGASPASSFQANAA